MNAILLVNLGVFRDFEKNFSFVPYIKKDSSNLSRPPLCKLFTNFVLIHKPEDLTIHNGAIKCSSVVKYNM